MLKFKIYKLVTVSGDQYSALTPYRLEEANEKPLDSENEAYEKIKKMDVKEKQMEKYVVLKEFIRK